MKLTSMTWRRAGKWIGISLLGLACAWLACAQTLSTTTVQGTVYLASGAPASGTLQLSWPAFTTASGAAVAAGRTTATIGADGFVSVNLVPNLGSTPAGLYYTAVYNLSDGTTSTEYCRNAALALAQAAASVSAAWSGSYKTTNLNFGGDVWPGDALQLNAPSTDLNAMVVVRAVKLRYTASVPDVVEYVIAFANDWAEDLAIRTGASVPTDTWLPALVEPTYLNNLNALAVTSMSGSTVTIDAGTTPPTGGGFEIRKRDFCFMAGEDPDLVMRASTRSMTFSRTSASDRYYVRMYDGSTPPNYSEFSAALFFNLPL